MGFARRIWDYGSQFLPAMFYHKNQQLDLEADERSQSRLFRKSASGSFGATVELGRLLLAYLSYKNYGLEEGLLTYITTSAAVIFFAGIGRAIDRKSNQRSLEHLIYD